MMIDFAAGRGAQGGHGTREGHLPGLTCCVSGHHDDPMAALLAGVRWPSARAWDRLRRPLGITIIGGLIFSQMLTLYTTPVIYLWFDRLARALLPHKRRAPFWKLARSLWRRGKP